MENSFWGNSDATVSFCENKYEKYYWIAEYHNTLSSISYIFVGLLFLKTRLKLLGKLLCFVGIGAMLLHATLQHWAQMGDEMSMLALSFYTIKELKPMTPRHLIFPILISYCLFNQYFSIFLIIFVIMQIIIAYFARNKINNKNKKWLTLYFVCFILGTVCWLLDQLCNINNSLLLKTYQLHAWWHFWTALSIGFGYLALL